MGSCDNNRLELLALEDLLPRFTNIVPKVLLEVGSQHGHDMKRLQTYFNCDNSGVFIVEAHPKFYLDIKNTYPEYNVFNFAATNMNGKIFFNAAKNDDDGRSSVLSRNIYTTDIFYTTECDTFTLSDFFYKNKITQVDIFKLDVEGLSYEVLQGCESYLDKIKCIQVETECVKLWNDQKTTTDNFNLLERNGFVLLWKLNIANLQDDSIWVRNDCLKL